MISDYKIFEPIGQGFSCKVYRAQNVKDQQFYAVKVLQHSIMKQEQLALLQSEIEILQSLKNSNIIKLHEVIKTHTVTYIVTELCLYGSLEDQLNKDSRFKEVQALNFLHQICNALLELKKNKIIHNDIKPSNIFITSNSFKLADFGFAMREGQMFKFNCGSPLYMSPETLNGNQHSYQTDIWSLGVTSYQLIYGFTPFKASNEQELLNCYYTMPISYKSIISLRLQNILSQMLEYDPVKRITVEQLQQLLMENQPLQSLGLKSKDTQRQKRLSIEKISQIKENIPPINGSKRLSYQPPPDNKSKEVEGVRNKRMAIEVEPKRLKSFHNQPFKLREQTLNMCQFVKLIRSEIIDNELLTYALTGIILYYTKQDQNHEHKQITVFVEQQKQPNIFQMVKGDLLTFCLSQLNFTIKFMMTQLEGIDQVIKFLRQKFYPVSVNTVRLLLNLYNLYRVLKSGDISNPLTPVNENIPYQEAMELLSQIYI